MPKTRQFWLVVTLVLLTFTVQASAIGAMTGRQVVFLATTAIVCAAPVFAHRRTLAIAAACTAMAANTVQTAGLGRALFLPTTGIDSVEGFVHIGPFAIAELLAALLLIVVLVRSASRTVATTAIAAIALVSLHAYLVRPDVSELRYESAVACAIMAAGAVVTGLLLRSRDRERAVVLAAECEQARREERLDMATELHDVVAHHVAGILVQAQAALVVSEKDPQAAAAMLPGIIAGGTNAMDTMRGLVRAEQTTATAAATTDLTADLNALIGSVRRSGLNVRARIDLTETIRPELGRSVLRLVQESLTNARKHARGATFVDVEVLQTTSVVQLSVSDNGTECPTRSGGTGLVGMRERVNALGGVFRAGWTGGGWQVAAELPLTAPT